MAAAALRIGVPRETVPHEKRVALVPGSVAALRASVQVEAGAGAAAGFDDAAYLAAGASVAPDAATLLGASDVVLKVAPPTPSEALLVKEGATLVSYLYPEANVEAARILATRSVRALALERLPRIARAQAMDTLSSQANLAGYKAALLAADALPRTMPLMMTAAGTLAPARALVIGAGVAGLQAIATFRRLGATVEAYDVRPAVQEEIESLGARFVDLGLVAPDAQTEGGYAREQTDAFQREQTARLAERVAQADVVVTTALVPGGRAPCLVSEDAVRRMRPGSVLVDLAAEQGGNCALTEPGATLARHGVTILGPLNVPSMLAPQASELFSRNVAAYLAAITKEGVVAPDPEDELVKGPLVRPVVA